MRVDVKATGKKERYLRYYCSVNSGGEVMGGHGKSPEHAITEAFKNLTKKYIEAYRAGRTVEIKP